MVLMARWVWPTATGVVTSATGVVVNVATDLMTEPWAWVGVVALTGLGVILAMKVQSAPAPLPASLPAPEPASVESLPEVPPTAGGVHNSVQGAVHGMVIQAGSIGSFNDRSVNQTAVARDGGTVHQAGRDIRSDGA